MEIRFTRHAKERMEERHITEATIVDALRSPDSIQYSRANPARALLKKHYQPSGAFKAHLLLVAYEQYEDYLLVITVIDTSKVEKYA